MTESSRDPEQTRRRSDQADEVAGVTILGASSDHLVLDTGAAPLPVGAEVTFGVDYSALVRAMTSPFVTKVFSSPTP